MGLELFMVGVVVEDMHRAAEFYRRLGVDVPEDAESKATPNGNTILLSASVGDDRSQPAGSPDQT
jgi:hypothetical protein